MPGPVIFGWQCLSPSPGGWRIRRSQVSCPPARDLRGQSREPSSPARRPVAPVRKNESTRSPSSAPSTAEVATRRPPRTADLVPGPDSGLQRCVTPPVWERLAPPGQFHCLNVKVVNREASLLHVAGSSLSALSRSQAARCDRRVAARTKAAQPLPVSWAGAPQKGEDRGEPPAAGPRASPGGDRDDVQGMTGTSHQPVPGP
jgi:hypothetical protein